MTTSTSEGGKHAATTTRSEPTVPAPTASGRYLGIEGMRAFAAFSVMTAHATSLRGSYVVPHTLDRIIYLGLHGVTLFFCLSGFLLYSPWVRATINGGRQPRTADFFRHRLLRIYPAYLVIFLVATAAGAVVLTAATYGEAPGQHVGRMTDPGLFFLNLVLLQDYVPKGVLTGLSVSWSLLPEVLFYLALPALALLGRSLSRRFGKTTAMLVPAGVLIVIGTIGRVVTYSLVTGSDGVVGYTWRNTGATWSAVLSHSFLSQCDLFGYGMVAAVLVTAAGHKARLLRNIAWAGLLIGLGSVAVLQQQDVATPFIGIACAGLILWITTSGRRGLAGRIGGFLETRVPHRLGVTSYSIYLWHFAVVIFVSQHVSAPSTFVGMVLRVVIVLVATVCLAEISYPLVEAPAMRFARRRDSRQNS